MVELFGQTRPCPNRELLVQFANAELAADQDASLASHCDTCLDCQEALAGIEREQAGILRPPPTLETLAVNDTQVETDFPSEIGPYRIRGLIGKGGMGIVLLADQQRPLPRRVALKLIKPGHGSREVLARFESERQTLARMNHPSICRVYDAGSIQGGRPYFVMEYVDGEPITSYSDRQRLTVRERIRLVAEVCDGVQHAHQRGVIHRDLKPSNLLITIRDSGAVPSIIDFGIAKATGADGGAATQHTLEGMLVGTPEYMSPEQAAADGTDVDTRSDVYSLGVVLYEILTGSRPFKLRRNDLAGLVDWQKQLAECDPQRPSQRVQLGDAGQPLAANRGSSPSELRRQLRGDLDWIALKALARSPDARYQSPAELAADLRCHLENRPVSARPPSAVDSIRKFSRRHRAVVVSGMLALLALTGGLIVSAMFAYRERQARLDLAHQVQVSDEVLGFLTDDLFSLASPAGEPDRDLSFREVIDRATEVATARRDLAPEVRCQILMELGKVYFDLGEYERSRDLFTEAGDDARRRLGEAHPLAMTGLDQVAKSYMRLGEFASAERALLKTIELQNAVLGPEHEDSVHSYAKLGDLYWMMGRTDEAIRITREVLETRIRLWGETYTFTLVSRNGLGLLYQQLGRAEEARRLFERAYRDGLRIHGAEHAYVLVYMHNLASSLMDLGRYAEAREMVQECLRIRRRVLPAGHPSTLDSEVLLASITNGQGDHEEALRMLSETAERGRQLAPRNHRLQAALLREEGACLLELARYDEAEQRLLQAYELALQELGPHHPRTTRAAGAMDRLFERWDDPQRARSWRDRKADVQRRSEHAG